MIAHLPHAVKLNLLKVNAIGLSALTILTCQFSLHCIIYYQEETVHTHMDCFILTLLRIKDSLRIKSYLSAVVVRIYYYDFGYNLCVHFIGCHFYSFTTHTHMTTTGSAYYEMIHFHYPFQIQQNFLYNLLRYKLNFYSISQVRPKELHSTLFLNNVFSTPKQGQTNISYFQIF